MTLEQYPIPSTGRAIWNGFKCRCPRCGAGKLYPKFIEQVAVCKVCGEPLARYNVGLFLPFIMIMIVAHVLIFVMLEMELSGRSSPAAYLMVMVPLSVLVPLLLLRPVKGAIIGFLWSRNLSDELD
ncbi:DUF983 domain-containing protein [Arsenicitalea aurantiaca]|uniref:DUF983 domain-containing protein n=1 Tax=Arsenicitalea aurantiaca TaxID=1783274 RepID=A0A433XEW5_9HYPH|nr:DUF983 domain-containing protein [Arsenicitalea aurantiaca]RUT32633.1 DUF983 domain-containing protein [Arsenicitalea aurantiaca]